MGPALPLIACSALAAAALVVRSDRARAWLLLGALLGAASILAVHVSDADQLDAAGEHRALLGAGIVAASCCWPRSRCCSRASPPRCRWPRSPRSRSGSRCRSEDRRRACCCRCTSSSRPARWPGRCPGSGRAPHPPRCRGLGDRAGGRAAAGDAGTWRPGGLEWSLAAVLVLYAAGSAWSSDTDRALENIVFFYVPSLCCSRCSRGWPGRRGSRAPRWECSRAWPPRSR